MKKKKLKSKIMSDCACRGISAVCRLLRFYGSTIAYVPILIWRETRKMSFASSLLRGVGASAEPHLLTWFTKLRSGDPHSPGWHIRQGFRSGFAWIQHDKFKVFSLFFFSGMIKKINPRDSQPKYKKNLIWKMQ